MRVIAIDGQAGSGKSTLARALADDLGLAYINTGIMYRALARAAVEEGIELDDAHALADRAQGFDFDLARSEVPPSLVVDGDAPGEELKSPAVEQAVSAVSRHSRVRAVMVAEQRKLASGGAVMEGRDIGSVVFPDATAKIFLRASEETRAVRRITERGGGDEFGAQLAARDSKDARTNAPAPAPGAVEIDTEDKNADEVLTEALHIVRAAIAERGDGA